MVEEWKVIITALAVKDKNSKLTKIDNSGYLLSKSGKSRIQVWQIHR